MKKQKNTVNEIALERFPDGTLINWGRNWHGSTVNGRPIAGEGGAVFYTGEAAEVMNLLLKHSGV